MQYITPSILFALVTLFCVGLFLLRYVRTAWNGPLGADWVRGRTGSGRLTFAGTCHPMEKQDRLPVLLITLVYAATAFFLLGDTTAPQSVYEFAGGKPVTIAVYGDAVYTTGIRYYSGLGTGAYNVEISADGENWLTLWQRKNDPEDTEKVTGWYWAQAEDYDPSYALTQKYNQLYKWIDITVENPQNVRFLRITGKAEKPNLQLSKFCLLGQDGRPVPFHWALADGSKAASEVRDLFSVDATVPAKSTWYNSTYFDEIYHARTAQEHIQGVYPYEVTHPPLGKLILGIGIRLFGMTPFGWRFMGTLFGVGMLPILYVFLKNLFGKTPAAACGTILFAVDFMHLTQTRIATIDTYGVFFILCMYFFLYRYLTLPAGTSFRQGALPLFLSGLMWGLGAASKWTVIYAAVGLAVLYFMGFYQKLRDWPEEQRGERAVWCVKTLAFSVLCFVVIPLCIYCAAYLPYAMAKGDTSLKGLLSTVWENQKYMLHYHEGVNQSHPYSSRWYQWIVDGRPILYYMDNTVPGFTTRFAAFSNPVVCWAGLGAVILCAVQAFRRRSAKAAFVVVGYLSQLVPWMFIGRTTFEYHYFPSILFLILALSFLFSGLMEADEGWRRPVYGLTCLSAGLYALFYPVLIGLTIPTWYEPLVKWIESWPF